MTKNGRRINKYINGTTLDDIGHSTTVEGQTDVKVEIVMYVYEPYHIHVCTTYISRGVTSLILIDLLRVQSTII